MSPLFVDPTQNDFRLQAGSPAIDMGTDVGLPYGGTAPDLGAYELDAILPDTTPPALSGVSVSVTDTTATVTWQTDQPGDTQVEYGLTAAYGSFTALNPILGTSA